MENVNAFRDRTVVEVNQKRSTHMKTSSNTAKVKPLRQIMQSELQAFLDVRARVESLSHALKEAEKEAAVYEEAIVGRLDKSVPVQDGLLYTVVEESTRLVVPWKELYARFAGPRAVEKVQAETEPKRYRKLKVLTHTEAA